MPRIKKTEEKLRGSAVVDTRIRDGVIPLGQHRINPDVLRTHLLISGKTGSGKSQLLIPIIDHVLADSGNNPETIVICTDANGEFTSKFYDPERDAIFNIPDARSEHWSPFREIKSPQDCSLIADALVPIAQSGQGQDWRKKAVDFVRDILSELVFGEPGADLTDEQRYDSAVKILSNTPEGKEEGIRVLGNTASIVHYDKFNAELLGSIIGVATPALRGLLRLRADGDWSVREWLRSAVDGTGKRVLFVPYKLKDRADLSGLIRAVLDLIVTETLDLTPSRTRHIHLIVDELDSLGRITSLDQSLTLGRKYGLCVTAAIQVLSQLEVTYGKDQARTLLGNFNSKVALGQADQATADYFSKQFGDYDLQKTIDSISEPHGETSSKSVSRQEHVERRIATISATELLTLNPMTGFAFLEGYSNVGSGQIYPVKVSILPYPSRVPAFIETTDDPDQVLEIDPSAPIPLRFRDPDAEPVIQKSRGLGRMGLLDFPVGVVQGFWWMVKLHTRKLYKGMASNGHPIIGWLIVFGAWAMTITFVSGFVLSTFFIGYNKATQDIHSLFHYTKPATKPAIEKSVLTEPRPAQVQQHQVASVSPVRQNPVSPVAPVVREEKAKKPTPESFALSTSVSGNIPGLSREISRSIAGTGFKTGSGGWTLNVSGLSRNCAVNPTSGTQLHLSGELDLTGPKGESASKSLDIVEDMGSDRSMTDINSACWGTIPGPEARMFGGKVHNWVSQEYRQFHKEGKK